MVGDSTRIFYNIWRHDPTAAYSRQQITTVVQKPDNDGHVEIV